MKVVCDRPALLEAVNLVAACVPVRSPSPALSCIKLSASKSKSGSELHLTGSDAETSIQLTLTQVEVDRPGQAVVSADKLRQIVQAVENEATLSIEIDGDMCRIDGARSRFKVFAHPPGDYPSPPAFAEVVSGSGPDAARAVFSHHAGALQALIARTAFSTARETSRYAINGVLLKRDGKKLEMVATDGRRLALARASIKASGGSGGSGAGGSGGEAGPVAVIIPTKALGLFSRLVANPEETVRVAVTDRRVFFAFEFEAPDRKDAAPAPARAVLSSVLVEGSFPPYEEVIPKDQDKHVVMDRESLMRAVREAAVLTNEESRGVRFAFSAKGKTLKLSSRAPEMGEAEIEVDLVSMEGDDIEISFNPIFVTDALKVLVEDEVHLDLKAPAKPGVLKSGTDFLYIVMPVNLPQ